MSCGSDGFCGDVELDVIRVAAILKVVAADDFYKGEHIEDEEEGTKHRTLGDLLGQRSSGGSAVIDMDELVSVGEVGFPPGECSVGDVE